MTRITAARLPLAVLAALLATSPLAAHETTVVSGASHDRPAYSARINFNDLDLRDKGDRMTLQRRVMDAAWAVCIEAEGKQSAAQAIGDSSGNCPNSTFDAARPQITAAVRRAHRGEQQAAMSLTLAVPARR